MDQPTKDERDFAMFTHLSPLAGYLAPLIGNIIGPLIMWQIKKDQSAFLERVGREALNFQITVVLAFVACIMGGIATLGIGFILLGPLMALIAVADLVLIVIAAIEASKGNEFRFPVCLRVVKGPDEPTAP